MGVQLASVVLICSNKRGPHPLDGCLARPVSGNLFKHWRVTHILDGCSVNLVSGSEMLKHWTHLLDGCPANLVSNSDLLKHWRDPLAGWVFRNPVNGIDLLVSDSQAGWVFSQSHQWFWSAQTVKSDWHSKLVFSQSYQRIWFAQTLKADSLPGGGVQPILSVVLLKHLSDSLAKWVLSQFCQWF